MKLDLTERQQVGAIIVAAGLAIFGLWFFLLMPQNRRCRGLERKIRTMSNELAQKNYLLGEKPLRNKRVREERRHADYVSQLKQSLSNLSMLPDKEEVTNASGRIDYKVALFDVRRRLRRKAQELGIPLPSHLGIEDSVDSNEDARKLMLQLRAAEETVDLALDLKIRNIQNVEPMPPVRHTVGPSKVEFLEEYPVRMDFYASTTNLYDLLQAVMDTNHVFAVKNLRMERASPRQGDLLVKAVLSALVFQDYTNELTVASAGPERPAQHPGY
jgi:hypothetical protein